MAVEPFALRPGAVHVWWCRTQPEPPPATIVPLLDILDSTEKARYERFHFDRHRLTFLCAHALLRALLSRYLGGPPAAWRFEAEQQGRPRLAGTQAEALDFNITHTEGLVACAFAVGARIGVDAESTRRHARWEELTRRVLSARERAELDAYTGDRQVRFFEYWTSKEAVSKVWGTGVGTDFRRIEVRFVAGAPEVVAVPVEHQRPTLLQLDAVDGYRLATAAVFAEKLLEGPACEVRPLATGWAKLLEI